MITARTRIVAPSSPVVTLPELYEHLHLDTEGSPPTHPEDVTLALRVQAATDEIDANMGWLQRALMPQRWRLRYDGFPCASDSNPDALLVLPFPPLISVDLVRYRDTSGAFVTLTEGTDYEVRDDSYGAWMDCSSIAPVYGGHWPTTARAGNAVEVTITCGYDDTASPPNPLPALVKQFVLVLAGTMYSFREEVAGNIQTSEVKQFREALANTLQVADQVNGG